MWLKREGKVQLWLESDMYKVRYKKCMLTDIDCRMPPKSSRRAIFYYIIDDKSSTPPPLIIHKEEAHDDASMSNCKLL